MSTSPNLHEQWNTLGAVTPGALSRARLDLHWAAQLVSAVGATLAEPAADDSHTSLSAMGPAFLFAGAWVTGDSPFCAALQFDTLEIQLHLRGRGCTHRFELDGQTYEQGLRWLVSATEAILGRKLDRPLCRKSYDMPAHSVGEGRAARFLCRRAESSELARWYYNADMMFKKLARTTPGSSPVRLWPHHFDLGMLITLGPDAAGADRSIGIGLSPGDENYGDPYWYANPYPNPATPRLPVIAPAHWHTEGWLGAVLPGQTVASEGDPARQAQQVERYFETALRACRTLLATRSDERE